MHDDHLLSGPCHQLLVDDEEILDPVILGQIGETLPLHARHVEYIRLADDSVQILKLPIGMAGRLDRLQDIGGQAQDLRADKYERYVVVQQQFGQAMHCAAKAQIPHHHNGQFVDLL